MLHCPSDQDIERYLATFTPTRRRPRSAAEEQDANGNELHSDPEDEDDILYQPRSCPIPEPHKWNCTPHEAETLNVTLVDFGKGKQLLYSQLYDVNMPFPWIRVPSSCAPFL